AVLLRGLEGEEGLRSTLQVGRGRSVLEDDERAGSPRGTACALGPGERRTVRLRRIGRGDRDRGRMARGFRARALAKVAKPVHGAGQRELRGTESVDEVAAPDAALLLQRLEDAVDGRETAWNTFRQDGL